MTTKEIDSLISNLNNIKAELITLKKYLSDGKVSLNSQDLIIARVAQILNLDTDSIIGPDRRSDLVDARMIIAKFMTELGYTSTSIAIKLNRHHTTVLNMVKQYVTYYGNNEPFIEKSDYCRVRIFDHENG